jgi:hypothetical protein
MKTVHVGLGETPPCPACEGSMTWVLASQEMGSGIYPVLTCNRCEYCVAVRATPEDAR